MKWIVAFMLLCFCFTAKAQKQRFSQAPPVPTAANTLKFHVTHSYFGIGGGLYLEGVIDGQKLELVNSTWSDGLLAPGDYNVVISATQPFRDGSFRCTYSILMADGKSSLFTLNGMSE